MSKIIEVSICTGTTCYVLGGSSLLSLADYIPNDLKPFVKVKGTTCLGYCSSDTHDKWPPYVSVDGLIVQSATIEGIVGAIRNALAVEKD